MLNHDKALILIKKTKALVLVVAVSLLIFGFSSGLTSRYGSVIEVIKRWSEDREVLIIHGINVYAQGNKAPTPSVVRFTPTPTPTPVFEDRSSSIRLKVEWPRALRALAKNPLLGTGYSSITLATDNDYLRALGEVGILGFGAFTLIFLRIFNKIIRKLRTDFNGLGSLEKAFVAGVIGAIPGILVNAVFIDVFEASKFAIIFWLVLGIFVSLIRDKKYVE